MLHQLPRPRARDRHAVERRGGRAHRHIRRWLRGPEPAQVKVLGKARPNDEEAVLRETRNRQVPHDPAGGIEHGGEREPSGLGYARDRKSTRLNSSHSHISYAVFCLKTKKTTTLP